MSQQFNIDYAIVQAFERAKGDRERSRGMHTFTIVLLAVFFVVMMGCLAAGASLYQGVARMQAQASDLHMQAGLLENIVRVNDAADALAVGEGPEGEALVLVERLESGTYETRVYLYEGAIVQEYAIAGRPYNPEDALKVVDSSLFEFSYDGGLVTIATDKGLWSIALRSTQSLPAGTASAGFDAAAAAVGTLGTAGGGA